MISIPIHTLDHLEIYTPMAKALVYWHVNALGFSVVASQDIDNGYPGISSWVLSSGPVKLVITSVYPIGHVPVNQEVASFIARNYCGVRKISLQVASVGEAFAESIAGGAIPLKMPAKTADENGWIEEASIKLFDNNEISFINRQSYNGPFKPGYKSRSHAAGNTSPLLTGIDHIASEVRINECHAWTNYLSSTIGTTMVQSIDPSAENKTGMKMQISQSPNRQLTLVIAEPESFQQASKIQTNVNNFGPGIHHLAFTTSDLMDTVAQLRKREVEFVNFPASYYDLLRENEELKAFDIDELQKNGILLDKEDDTYLLQKFIKPISDRPFFLYELVQRINGYNGFALKNINVLKRAEEMELKNA